MKKKITAKTMIGRAHARISDFRRGTLSLDRAASMIEEAILRAAQLCRTDADAAMVEAFANTVRLSNP